LRDIGRKLESLVQAGCPFKKKPLANAPVHWVRPELVCEVSFREWTKRRIHDCLKRDILLHVIAKHELRVGGKERGGKLLQDVRENRAACV